MTHSDSMREFVIRNLIGFWIKFGQLTDAPRKRDGKAA